MAPITVGVVDDHDVVRGGVRAMAEQAADLRFWGAAEHADGLEQLVIEFGAPDVLLLDLRLGSEDGVDLCRRLLADHPGMRILIFTAYGNLELFGAAVRAGAAGYVLKDTSMSNLPAIIRFVSEGSSTYCDPKLADELIEKTFQDDNGRTKALTARESDVLRLVAEGKSNREIAEVLCISSHTAKFHVSRLMRRFRATRRAQLIRSAYENGLL